MIVFCQNSLGVGTTVRPIISALSGSAGSSARAVGADDIDSRVIDAPT
ncbi:hypothetical protein [Mycobacterium cookii]|nr:hypothetical protein [Mycobacterium cookii]MCV7331615.1 hypothetical protein [Mycobacterium cookii]